MWRGHGNADDVLMSRREDEQWCRRYLFCGLEVSIAQRPTAEMQAADLPHDLRPVKRGQLDRYCVLCTKSIILGSRRNAHDGLHCRLQSDDWKPCDEGENISIFDTG